MKLKIKISKFEESVRKFSNDKNYTLTNLLLKGHILLKSSSRSN